MNGLSEQVVLITGGTNGFGKATAELLFKKGARVIITGRDEERLLNAKKSIGEIDYFVADVTNSQNWEELYDYINKKYGRLDILINNAGGGISITGILDQRFEDIDQIISLNLNSVIYGCRTFGRMMTEQKQGTIINISSVCAKHAWPKWNVYAAAKWGVLGFSKALYVELQPYNIRVTCVIPGLSSTNFQSSAGKKPVNAQLKPSDVAETIFNICAMPSHVVIEEAIVCGIDQIVNPL